MSHKLSLHRERRLGSKGLLGSVGRLRGLKRLLGGVSSLRRLERLLGGEGRLCSLERLLGGKSSLHGERLLAAEGGLCLHGVGRLWGLKGLLSGVGRLSLGLLREKQGPCWSPQLPYLTHLSYLGKEVIG